MDRELPLTPTMNTTHRKQRNCQHGTSRGVETNKASAVCRVQTDPRGNHDDAQPVHTTPPAADIAPYPTRECCIANTHAPNGNGPHESKPVQTPTSQRTFRGALLDRLGVDAAPVTAVDAAAFVASAGACAGASTRGRKRSGRPAAHARRKASRRRERQRAVGSIAVGAGRRQRIEILRGPFRGFRAAAGCRAPERHATLIKGREVPQSVGKCGLSDEEIARLWQLEGAAWG